MLCLGGRQRLLQQVRCGADEKSERYAHLSLDMGKCASCTSIIFSFLEWVTHCVPFRNNLWDYNLIDNAVCWCGGSVWSVFTDGYGSSRTQFAGNILKSSLHGPKEMAAQMGLHYSTQMASPPIRSGCYLKKKKYLIEANNISAEGMLWSPEEKRKSDWPGTTWQRTVEGDMCFPSWPPQKKEWETCRPWEYERNLYSPARHHEVHWMVIA